jgi:hypothetical protein
MYLRPNLTHSEVSRPTSGPDFEFGPIAPVCFATDVEQQVELFYYVM